MFSGTYDYPCLLPPDDTFVKLWKIIFQPLAHCCPGDCWGLVPCASPAPALPQRLPGDYLSGSGAVATTGTGGGWGVAMTEQR